MESVICPLFKQACDFPDTLALISSNESLTYQQLHEKVQQLCHLLIKEKVNITSRVAFIADSTTETLLLFLALFRLKAVACPLSNRIVKEQLHSYLSRLSATHFLDPMQLYLKLKKCTYPDPDWLSFNQLATFLFTSGSSGMPKIACHSFGNHYYNALGALTSLGLNSQSRYLLSLPLFHVSGIAIMFRTLMSGATIVLSKESLTHVLNAFEITHASVVPTQLYRLLQEKQKFKSLRCLLLGGAPLSEELRIESLNAQLPLFTTYGMTEMSSMITLSTLQTRHNQHLASSGQLLEFREMKIDEFQEIYVKGKTLFQGYWNNETQQITLEDQNEWFPTKDLGEIKENNLKIIGRKDRQFISGGENIQPEEIENALLKISGIQRAIVIPVDDNEFGQRPIAFIDDKTEQHTLASIKAILAQQLPSFKHPIKILPYPKEDLGLKFNLTILNNIYNATFSKEKPVGFT